MASAKELVKLFAVALFLIACIVFFYSCSSTVYPPSPLSLAQMRFRPGDVGPSTQTCLAYKGDACTNMQKDVFDLKDVAVRKRLRDSRIFCFAFGKRYHVCANDPGICHTYEKVDRILGIPTKRTIVIDEIIAMPDGYQKLVDANAHCAAIGSPTYEDIATPALK